jgi:serine protease Do
MRSLLCAAASFTAALCLTHAQQDTAKPSRLVTFGPDAQIVWTDATSSEISRQMERSPWQPAVNAERHRGSTALYTRVSPSVVVVRTETGHGTGFILGSSGLVLTNHHVVSNSLIHDVTRTASYANVHVGRLGSDGIMTMGSQAARAYLLKLDASLDLALLKLDPSAMAGGPLPGLKLAVAAPRPGMSATIIGHPASGMLWTMRSGEVASVGSMPADMVDIIMTQLSASPQVRQQLVDQLKAVPQRRIILTSTGANPGDSGGPVLDAAGNVIAVTFAGPAETAHAKFTYHIHLDEVRRFMASVPPTPMLDLPDPWQLRARVDLQDLDGDHKPDVLIAGNQAPEQLLFDLDNDTSTEALRDRTTLARNHTWDFEFALRVASDEQTSSAFYDTNNDGTVDLIHTVADGDHARNWRFTREADGKWRVEQNVSLTFPSPSLLQNSRLAERLAGMLKRGKSSE